MKINKYEEQKKKTSSLRKKNSADNISNLREFDKKNKNLVHGKLMLPLFWSFFFFVELNNNKKYLLKYYVNY